MSTEEGRKLASQRDDLIAQGVDPADLDVPFTPEPEWLWVGANPPYSVTYIDPKVTGSGEGEQWFVMGTVDGNPRNPQGPVAICDYEPAALAIAALLNVTIDGYVEVQP